VAVFHTGKVATQEARTPLDIALGKAALSAVTSDHFPDIYFRFFFWHGIHTFLTRRVSYAAEQKRARGFFIIVIANSKVVIAGPESGLRYLREIFSLGTGNLRLRAGKTMTDCSTTRFMLRA
jgi:hypothetical protein